MSNTLRSSTLRLAVATLAIALAACSDDDPVAVVPELTTITVTSPATSLSFGEKATATAAAVDQNGQPFTLSTVTWSTTTANVATVNQSGEISGVGAGTTQIIASSDGRAGSVSVSVVAPPGLIVNEVESNGGTPGDWVELYNPTAAAISLSGWVLKDNDDTHTWTIPAGTSIAAGAYLVLEEAQFVYGLGAADAVRLFNPFSYLVTSYEWTAHAATTYGRCPNLTGSLTTTTSATKAAANDCSVAIKINEIESNGGTPGDWVELYNAGGSLVDLTGYVFKDNDDTRTFAIAAGATIAPGGYYVLEEAQFNFGLGQPDAARLYLPGGTTIVDSHTWTTHAATTLVRCPNATGAFVESVTSTKGAVNACPGTGPTAVAWPGADDVATVDGLNVFQTNLSGLTYEGASGGNPAVLWAVRNGPGTLYRLIFSGGIWTPDPANNWVAGKALKYLDGTGNTDAEGVTFTTGSAAGIYVSTERNNDASTISRNSILRFDPSAAGATLTATNDWNITADLPTVGANLGIETIQWIPDTFLTVRGFLDEATGAAYSPATYPNHGTGIFFVGVEGNGNVYAYALNHTNNTFTRVATIVTGYAGIMALEFDAELNNFWAVCDDGCGGLLGTLEIDQGATSPTPGKFRMTRLFNRPPSMPNLNNEGFAVTPQSECVNGRKPVFWSDDAETGGHSIRRASIACTPF